MSNQQCYCLSGFSGKSCGKSLNTKLTENSNGSIYWQMDAIHIETCYKGTWMSSVGFCLCNLGWKGIECDEPDKFVFTNF